MSISNRPRNAKPWPLPRARGYFLIRKRRSLLLLYALVFLGLFGHFYLAGFINLKTLGLHDPLWSYTHVNASDTMFPPHDPTYVVFEPPRFEYRPQTANVPIHEDETPQGARRLPFDCVDAYFTTALSCHAGPDPPLDVVWTWVNGSDRLFQDSLAHAVRTTTPKMPATSRANTQLFRDHDELRHSIRSVLKHFSGSTTQLYIVTSDFPLPIPVMDGEHVINGTRRLGLVPHWLDPKHAADWRHGDVRLGMKYHSEIFRTHNGSNFNSYGIETQLVNIRGVSENFIYMNDDFFMLADMAASDFYTSAYGVVLRMQADLLVKNSNDPYASVGGEWGPLEYTNWCLSNRFGNRLRPYVAHAAKTVSLGLMKEFSIMWHAELAVTASHTFRGMKEGHGDIYSLFLFSHSLVERWREGLLWSWAVAKLGGVRDEWGPAEKESAWREVGGKPGDAKVSVMMGARATLREDIVHARLQAAGHSMSGKTKYTFASGDGYPYDYRDSKGILGWPTFTSPGELICTINYQECFDKPDVQKASDFFKHIAFEQPRSCGDCIIHALRAASGTVGLSAFLPDAGRNLTLGMVEADDQSQDESLVDDPPHLPLVSDWRRGNFAMQSVIQLNGIVNIRHWTLRMLERYRFVLGHTPTIFHMITSATGARARLKKVDEDKDAALLCLNDNIVGLSRKADVLLLEWQEQRWGRKAEWER